MSKRVKRNLKIGGIAFLHFVVTLYFSVWELDFILHRAHHSLDPSMAPLGFLVDVTNYVLEFPLMTLMRFIVWITGNTLIGGLLAPLCYLLDSVIWANLIYIVYTRKLTKDQNVKQ